MDFSDVTKFTSLTEYWIYTCAIIFMFASEFAIWIFSSRGRKKDSKRSDQGSVWFIIFAFIFSIFISYYFTSHGINQTLKNMRLPHIFCYIGIILVTSGTLIRDSAVWTLKTAFTLSVQTTKDQHLIKKRVYNKIRNPAYTGSILSLLGIALALRNVFAPFIVLLVCLICYSIRINVEEKALSKQFGKEFDDYCEHTYKLFPYLC